MKKMLLVINPNAGTRRVRKYLVEILEIFNRRDYDVATYITAAQGDATRIVQERAKDVDLVVCAGGDGTFNEMVTGLLRSGAKVPVGYIPCGTTNDFAMSLKLSTNLLQAARDIVDGEPQNYDVGKFGDRYFTYVASFGIFTKAAYATPQKIKNAFGHLAYVFEGIQEISQIKRIPMRLELSDQVIEDAFVFGAISNSTSLGKVLTLDPKRVDLRDGLFELMLIRAPKDLAELSDCLRALQTQKYDCDAITFVSTDRVRVATDAALPWTLDGEKEDSQNAIFVENLHNAIQIMEKKK